MNIGATATSQPMPQSVPQAFALDLTDRRLQAIMNLAVFTPYAIYLARGTRPPGWLIAASLAWLGINALDDLSYLWMGENGSGFYGLSGAPGDCGCAGLGNSRDPHIEAQGIVTGARPPPLWATPPQVAWSRYRVNR